VRLSKVGEGLRSERRRGGRRRAGEEEEVGEPAVVERERKKRYSQPI